MRRWAGVRACVPYLHVWSSPFVCAQFKWFAGPLDANMDKFARLWPDSLSTVEPLRDLEQAQQLTSYLHTESGLTCYHMLFCMSNSVSQLHDYEWVRQTGYSDNGEGAIDDATLRQVEPVEPRLPVPAEDEAPRCARHCLQVAVLDLAELLAVMGL